MPKRARIDDKRSRQKDKLRKRQKRQQKACSSAVTPPDETTESVVPCGSMDGAVSAPPGNLPGFGLMGLPPKEEKKKKNFERGIIHRNKRQSKVSQKVVR